MEMQRESQKDRTILCRYDPTEVRIYSKMYFELCLFNVFCVPSL